MTLIAFLNQWAPWYVVAIGAFGVISMTVMYGPYVRILKRAATSNFTASRLNNPEIPDAFRRLFNWFTLRIESPGMRWISLVWSALVLASGVVWLELR